MPNILKEVRILLKEGMIHQKLINRTGLLLGVSLILGAIVVYNLMVYNANPLVAGMLAVASFPLGMYVFSRMNVVHWNEDESVVQLGKMDIIGFGVYHI
jgi:hypothetical protein